MTDDRVFRDGARDRVDSWRNWAFGELSEFRRLCAEEADTFVVDHAGRETYSILEPVLWEGFGTTVSRATFRRIG
jgi:hypothetical protein